MASEKIVLIILDGWGYAPSWGGNAVETAYKPNFDNYWRKYPHTILKASEEAVGLPRHEPGNSEVGHLNLGCGQIVRQNLPGITGIIQDGSFAKNPVLLEAIDHVKKNQSNLHLLGLVSDGGVHSHISHLFALLDLLKANSVDRTYIHMITDGRDTSPMKALSFAAGLNTKLREIGFGKIASVMGRYYAMDRDNRWDRVQKAYDVLVSSMGPQAENPEKAIAESYRQGRYDEFIIPTAISGQSSPAVPIRNNDAIIFFNFRGDRAKEITEAFVEPKFHRFHRSKFLSNLYFASFAYHEEYENRLPVHVVFKQQKDVNPIAKVLSANKLTQCHIAETEKYAHVTYFFDGGSETALPGEKYELIPSPKVASYDLKPEMSAYKISETLVAKLDNFDFWVVNYANPDMVGHTGNLKAATRACEVVDECLGVVVKEILKQNFTAIITADHGNAEQMINPTNGEPHTEHTISPVPFLLVSKNPALQNPLRAENSEGLKLSDVAPTVLKIMNLEKPPQMTGQSLVV